MYWSLARRFAPVPRPWLRVNDWAARCVFPDVSEQEQLRSASRV